MTTGWKNFTRVFTDEGVQKPFLAIFVWTVVFSLITVFLTVAVGMILACLVQWEALRGKAVYRVLLICLRGAIVHFNLDFQRIV